MLTNVNYVTVTELMKRWRCSRPTVLRYLRKFDVRFVQLGENLWFRKARSLGLKI